MMEFFGGFGRKMRDDRDGATSGVARRVSCGFLFGQSPPVLGKRYTTIVPSVQQYGEDINEHLRDVS